MLKVYTGSYVGDSANGRLVTTNIAGTVRYAQIMPLTPMPTAFKTSEPPLAGFKLSDGSISAGGWTFGPDANWTVDATAGINQIGITYQWYALAE